MHAPFLGLKVNSFTSCLQQKFEGKAQALTPNWGNKKPARRPALRCERMTRTYARRDSLADTYGGASMAAEASSALEH
jgi:hypothetical protein